MTQRIEFQFLQHTLPIELTSLALKKGVGLVLVDEVIGFAGIGGGNLAPPTENAQVSQMVKESDRLARAFAERGWPILAFMDCHEPGKAEPPYPPHCEEGSGEEELVPELRWLEQESTATLLKKDCINGFIGAIDKKNGLNHFTAWLERNQLKEILVAGICTDICVMDFVLTLLSVRNHGLAAMLESIFVYEPGCATYDLSSEKAAEMGLPKTAAHPQMFTHHMGLYFMASRGAKLISDVRFD